MGCRARREQRTFVLQQQLLREPQSLPYQRGCCGRRQQRRLLAADAARSKSHQEVIQIPQFGASGSGSRQQPHSMAGIIAVGIALGAEKLNKKISEKKTQKERQEMAQREAILSAGESSLTASAIREHENGRGRNQQRTEKMEQEEWYEQRRNLSEERIAGEEAPPGYNDVLAQNQRHM